MTGTIGENANQKYLTWWICAAIVLAIAVAVLAPRFAMALEVGGEVFLRLLKMVVVPLVFTSVLNGMLGLGDVRKLGRPGAAAVGYYTGTTLLAVLVGLAVVNIIQPGVGVLDGEPPNTYSQPGVDSPKQRMASALAGVTGLSEREVGTVFAELPAGQPEQPTVGTILKNLLLILVTENLVVSAAKTELLPIIVFAIVFGGMLTTIRTQVTTMAELVEQANVALMQFVLLLMKVAPLGIFCLVAARFGEARAEGEFLRELTQIGWYFTCVVLGLAIHAFGVLPLIFWVVRRQNPFRFMSQMSQALLTAFSTASSSATLPVTMDQTMRAGISKRSTEFVLPLGATMNMDGTALYEAVAAVFIAQAVGYDLSLMQQGIIAVTATLAAIGAAGIPEAGLVTMLIVLNAVGLPSEYIGLILSVDWLLDRFRTAVNVFGDAVGAAVVETTLPADHSPAHSVPGEQGGHREADEGGHPGAAPGRGGQLRDCWRQRTA